MIIMIMIIINIIILLLVCQSFISCYLASTRAYWPLEMNGNQLTIFPGWRTFGGSQVNFMVVVFNLIAITFQGASTLNKKGKCKKPSFILK